MARVGSNVIAIRVTAASTTASFHNISDYVREISGLNVEAMLTESHTFGDSWVEQTYVGVAQIGDITISGFHDDSSGAASSNSPHALFGTIAALGSERVVKLNLGTTNEYPKFDVLIKSYSRTPSVGELTGYEVVLSPTGAMTYVTT